MIFFMNNAGIVIKSVPVEVNEGSANANNIYLVAPFAANLSATVAFKLPDGIITPKYGLTPTGEIPGFTDAKGNKYNGWSYALPNNITEKYGEVTAQFFFYSASSPVRVLASSATTFTVARGVAAILPDTPSEDVYEQILSTLAQIQSDLTNGYYTARAIYAWNSSYTYGANDLVYFPVQNGHGKFVKSIINNNTQPPYDVIDGAYVLQSNWQEVLDFDEVYALAQEAADVLDDAKEQAGIATQAASSATAAMNSAQGSASSANTSASNAANAANNAAISAQDAAESARKAAEAVVNYYTKSEIDGSVGTSLDADMDTTTYIVTLTLKSKDGTTLSTTSIDLPLESVIVSGTYDADTKEIVLTLHNGDEVRIPVGDLVEGLATQEALDDVIDGTTPVAKATNADNAETAKVAGKVENKLTVIVDGVSTEYDGSTAQNVIVNTAGQEVGNGQITITQNGEVKGSFTVNQSYNGEIDITTVDEENVIIGLPAIYNVNSDGLKTHGFVGSCGSDGVVSGQWVNIVNVRHRNGTGDGNLYGMQIISDMMNSEPPLMFRKQRGAESWDEWRKIYDTANPPTPEEVGAVKVGGIFTGDLNNLIENGTYFIQQGSTNLPNTDPWGELFVMQNNDNIVQIYVNLRNIMYMRYGNPPNVGGQGTWTEWQSIYGSGNLPPAVQDATNGRSIQLDYGSDAMAWSDVTYIAAWNGYRLQCFDKNSIPPLGVTGTLNTGSIAFPGQITTPNTKYAMYVTVWGEETAEYGTLTLRLNNDSGSILASAHGNAGYWGKQTICASALVPAGNHVYVTGSKMGTISYSRLILS